MKRTTITLPDDLALVLDREARRRDTSVSDVVRQALTEHLQPMRGTRRLGFVALGRSGKRHTAREAEAILAREWDRVRDR
jgi:Arc/MetJ-type ribon-helix-helix transcriptional regulator